MPNTDQATIEATTCYHCGEKCVTTRIKLEDKQFCCEGCKMVYQLLQENDLCTYYDLNNNPGQSQRMTVRPDKFAFLDDEKMAGRLITYKDAKQVQAVFYLPQMHCSSCLYLLENLHRIHPGALSSKVNFTRKELEVIIDPSAISLRQTAELLTSIGYEPYISLNDLKEKRPGLDKALVYQLGVAGFCFGNIMLLSFPEYLGVEHAEEGLRDVFRWLNFALALPVLLYSSLPFYQSSWKSLKHRYLNIDAPIALAIIITFVRSAVEVIGGTGGGYFDSMSGIVFFMLVGRVLQDKTYRQLSFERDYTSYFPIAVSVLKDGKEIPTPLPDIKVGDTLLIHNEELVPADGILTRGKGFIDYSFVTGESIPVVREMGEMLYAGGKQTGGAIELLVVKEVAQSYLTRLWNRDSFKETKDKPSFVDLLSRYFTIIVFTIATITAIFWAFNDSSKIWPAVTSIFIIACPCALLLSNSFTNGNMLRILSRNGLYLRNAATIETLAEIDHIVFDKTGTLTQAAQQDVRWQGEQLTDEQKQMLAALTRQSSHPLNQALQANFPLEHELDVTDFSETPGKGMKGIILGKWIEMGSSEFVTGHAKDEKETRVYLSIHKKPLGYFHFSNHYRESLPALIKELKPNFKLSVLSGDNDAERQNLHDLLGLFAGIHFRQKPEDKLHYIESLQRKGEKVMMVGDGLNDAGALKQADIGLAISEQNNNFTPASDAIIEAKKLPLLYCFIQIARANKKIVIASFILSIVYNIIGLFFAVQGNLSPLIAAILMPSSSLSIILLTFGASGLVARWKRL
ncbi:MAG: heavy metal translocating P-type ATPase metal-binding domain-containing protein [Chitinophagaceae bacterium]|nr:heavy metal translocating P-type ATPase metal-binding domain-containing protein [Chitinophagaceae bacterium]